MHSMKSVHCASGVKRDGGGEQTKPPLEKVNEWMRWLWGGSRGCRTNTKHNNLHLDANLSRIETDRQTPRMYHIKGHCSFVQARRLPKNSWILNKVREKRTRRNGNGARNLFKAVRVKGDVEFGNTGGWIVLELYIHHPLAGWSPLRSCPPFKLSTFISDKCMKVSTYLLLDDIRKIARTYQFEHQFELFHPFTNELWTNPFIRFLSFVWSNFPFLHYLGYRSSAYFVSLLCSHILII